MDYQFETWSIESLIEYARNPRKNDHAVDKVASAIKEFGFRVPIVAKSDGTIVDGHLRLKAAKKLNLTEVPVILADDLTDTQIKAFRLSVNKVAELADWDDDLLKLELQELDDLGFDLSLTGFDQDEIDDLFDVREETENEYTQKVDTPVYEPTGEKPEITDLFDDSRTKQLLADIMTSDLPEEEKQFLSLAAGRHTVLNFEQIANYYAHASKECQELMEDNALVIVDFNKAIELGYVTMSDKISEQYSKDYPDDEE